MTNAGEKEARDSLIHLQGQDYEAGEEEARAMENDERRVLAALGYPDPYGEDE